MITKTKARELIDLIRDPSTTREGLDYVAQELETAFECKKPNKKSPIDRVKTRLLQQYLKVQMGYEYSHLARERCDGTIEVFKYYFDSTRGEIHKQWEQVRLVETETYNDYLKYLCNVLKFSMNQFQQYVTYLNVNQVRNDL